MGKNKLIKTGLYFILVVLVLTATCVVVYTAREGDGSANTPASDPMQEQAATAEDEMTDLQQVSSTTRAKTPDTKSADPSESQQTPVSAPAQNTTTYQLIVTDGCLQVCIAETGILYMETAIEYDLLPENVQAQIADGKFFESEAELLEFLENYSS